MLKRETLKPLLQRADAAAGEFHRVRAEADRLTRWHRLPAEDRSGEPELRRGLTEPPPVVFAPAAPTAPAGDSRGAEADHYIVRESAPGGPDQLLSPEGDQSYTVLDVPTDGDGFFHALAEGLHHADPEMLSRRVEVADRQMIIDGLRGLLADELNRPENTDLLDFTSPDTKDAFSGSELADSGVSFAEGTPSAASSTARAAYRCTPSCRVSSVAVSPGRSCSVGVTPRTVRDGTTAPPTCCPRWPPVPSTRGSPWSARTERSRTSGPFPRRATTPEKSSHTSCCSCRIGTTGRLCRPATPGNSPRCPWQPRGNRRRP